MFSGFKVKKRKLKLYSDEGVTKESPVLLNLGQPLNVAPNHGRDPEFNIVARTSPIQDCFHWYAIHCAI